jgi:MFS family permease
VFLGVLFAIGGSVGNVLGGWLGDWCSQHWQGGRLLAIVGVVVLLTPFTILYRLLPASSPLFPVACCLGSILITLGYGPVLGTVQDLTPPRVRATTVALTLLGQNLLGSSLGVLVAALLREPLGGLTWSLLVTGQAGLLALPLYLLAVRWYPKDPARRALLAEVAV